MTMAELETVARAAIVVTIGCAAIIAADIIAGRRQKMWIMNLVWPITALYFGPIGLWAYWKLGRSTTSRATRAESLADHSNARGGKPERPFWQTTFIAACHCGAGCVIGDLIGESALFFTGFTLFGSKPATAYLVDFVLAYAFGIAFQYFTIAPMRHLGFRDGLIAALKADTISLTAFEVGMFGWMALNRRVFFPTPPQPNTFAFWFLMQFAMIVGFATSYPANWWLVKAGIKEAM